MSNVIQNTLTFPVSNEPLHFRWWRKFHQNDISVLLHADYIHIAREYQHMVQDIETFVGIFIFISMGFKNIPPNKFPTEITMG